LGLLARQITANHASGSECGMTLDDLQRMGEASEPQPKKKIPLAACLQLSKIVNDLRKLRTCEQLEGYGLAQRKIAQACQKLAAAAKDLQNAQ
jgi:hypothetical protein